MTNIEPEQPPRVRYAIEDNIGILTFCRPDIRNRLDKVFTSQLVEGLQRAGSDISVRCVIICAEGNTFCAGGDIKAMHARTGHFAGGPVDNHRTYVDGVQRLARAFYSTDVPVIAAVGGAAMGAGLDIAAMCDIRIASTEARFAESFIRLGLVSAAGGAWFLQRAIGSAAAAELTLTGREFDAARALQLGLVSRVVSPGELLSTARSIAAEIAVHPPHSVRLNKRLLRESANASLHHALELAAAYQGLVQHTSDQREAVAAVIEKRPARYEGK
jgi:enoyl-CoA hydratase/carnithine racemase